MLDIPVKCVGQGGGSIFLGHFDSTSWNVVRTPWCREPKAGHKGETNSN